MLGSLEASSTPEVSEAEGGGGCGPEEDPDLAKIKKVQSFFRGWLCRSVRWCTQNNRLIN